MQQIKAAETGLEDILDWTRIADSEPTEEEEMFSLAAGFVTRRSKRSVNQRVWTPLVLGRSDLGDLLQVRRLRRTRM